MTPDGHNAPTATGGVLPTDHLTSNNVKVVPMSKSTSPLQAAGMRLGGLKRTGTPEQIRDAEHAVAALWLERYIQEAVDRGLDAPTRRRLAKMLMAGGAQ